MGKPLFFYHIVTPIQWKQFEGKNYYESPSLQTEGFIHGSTAEQLEVSIDLYYKEEPEVWVLKIESSKLQSELKYEPASSRNGFFPHIYGPLNKDAIVEIYKIKPGNDKKMNIR